MRMTFLGAAGTVTGSKYLLEQGEQRILIDCGLFQGYKQLRLHNWDPFDLPMRELDAIVLTHAHLDHSGYLPVLARNGYRGPIYASPATCELVKILLRDSARLQEEEAEYANRKGFSRHDPALPLYTLENAERALKLLRPIAFEHPVEIARGGDDIAAPRRAYPRRRHGSGTGWRPDAGVFRGPGTAGGPGDVCPTGHRAGGLSAGGIYLR